MECSYLAFCGSKLSLLSFAKAGQKYTASFNPENRGKTTRRDRYSTRTFSSLVLLDHWRGRSAFAAEYRSRRLEAAIFH